MMLNYIIKLFTYFSTWCYIASIKKLFFTPFLAQLMYLLFISFLGYLALEVTTLRVDRLTRLGRLDAAFMSISAVTSSSMSTVEMEVFTNTQLVFFIVLMFLGGEVFMSMVGLFIHSFSMLKPSSTAATATVSDSTTNSSSLVELGTLPNDNKPSFEDDNVVKISKQKVIKTLAYVILTYITLIHFFGSLFVYLYMITIPSTTQVMKSKSILPITFSIFLTSSSFANCGFVPTNENMAIFKNNSVLLLLVIPQVLMGNTFYPICIRTLIYLIESFAIVTKNRYYDTSLYTYMLRVSKNDNGDGMLYDHLLSSEETWWLGWTGVGFLVSQFVMIVSMDWRSQAFEGMSWFQKVVACLFQSVSSRHSGESVVADLSTLSTAVLLLFIIMMYFPPYFTFMLHESDPIKHNPAATDHNQLESITRIRSSEPDNTNKNKNNKLIFRLENVIFSQLSYLAIFVILIAITERNSFKTDPLNFNLLNILIEVIRYIKLKYMGSKRIILNGKIEEIIIIVDHMKSTIILTSIIAITERNSFKTDPLNFNLLNILMEVISAYGNVGFSMGYSCKKRLEPGLFCEEKAYGFAGRWTDNGKMILIVVMIFGKLKRFNMKGGKAWKTL